MGVVVALREPFIVAGDGTGALSELIGKFTEFALRFVGLDNVVVMVLVVVGIVEDIVVVEVEFVFALVWPAVPLLLDWVAAFCCCCCCCVLC